MATSAFEESGRFDPDRDSKVPVRRDPLSLLIRLCVLLATLLVSRHPLDAWTWIRSMASRKRMVSYPLPWITFDAARAIRSRLPERARIFEYGGGNSTVYWARLGHDVHTMEGDAEWADLLIRQLASEGLTNAHVRRAPDIESYVPAIHEWPHDHFDLVVVDGSWRRECVAAAVSHVRPGGVLVVDNTDWHWFRTQPIEGIPPTWQTLVYPGYAPMMGHASETTLYIRAA